MIDLIFLAAQAIWIVWIVAADIGWNWALMLVPLWVYLGSIAIAGAIIMWSRKK